MAETILPPNATALEIALDLQSGRISDLPVLHHTAFNPWTCPESVLPYLAWALSVDVWDSSWPINRRRAVVAAALRVHRRKGTPGAVEDALQAVNAAAQVIEWFDYPGGPGDPSHFRVDVEIGDRGLTEDETDLLTRIALNSKNVRSRLDGLTISLISEGGVPKVAAGAAFGTDTTIEPMSATDLTAEAGIPFMGAAVQGGSFTVLEVELP